MKKAVEDGIDLKGYMMWAPIDIISSSTGEMKSVMDLFILIKMITVMEIIQDIQKIRFIGIRKLLRQMAKFYKIFKY